MGVGNRFKKQGPPAPLDESLVTRKRKDAPAKPEPDVKRRRRSHGEPPKTGRGAKGAKGAAAATIERQPRIKALPAPVKASNSKTAALPIALEDEFGLSDDEDGIDDPDIMEDEMDTVDADRLGAADSSDLDEDTLQDAFDDALNGDVDPAGLDSDSDVMDSDGEEEAVGTKGMWSSDEEDLDDLNAANMEGMSNQLDIKAAQEAANAQAELEEAALQTNITGDGPQLDHDSDEEPALKTRLAPDLQLLRTRITDNLRSLDKAIKKSENAPPRADIVKQLLKDICAYYGYSAFLAEKLFNIFPPQEAFAFFEANETPRPVVLRTNTLRTHRRELAQSLINRGVTLEPVGKWSKVGLQVFESAVPLGATPEYLAGHYILQAASSFLPVMALAPQEHERVLDMASAPGGKVTHIAALMKNTGCIFANDSNKQRTKALIGNIHRLGAKNTIVCSYDGLEFPRVMGGFDRVLLDAPCSGTGVIAKDASVKTNKSEKDFIRLPELQKKLLLAAIDSVDHASKTGGYVVYSTCSVTVEENEQVVQYALMKRPNVKLVETGLTFGKEGFVSYMGKKFHHSLSMTRRYYPHAYNVDGFFVSKFKKTGLTRSVAGTAIAGSMNGVNIDADQISAHEAVAYSEVETTSGAETGDDDEFEGFDDDEDAEIIERARRAALKRRGLNPKADKSKAKVKPIDKNKDDEATKSVKVNGDAHPVSPKERKVDPSKPSTKSKSTVKSTTDHAAKPAVVNGSQKAKAMPSNEASKDKVKVPAVGNGSKASLKSKDTAADMQLKQEMKDGQARAKPTPKSKLSKKASNGSLR